MTGKDRLTDLFAKAAQGRQAPQKGKKPPAPAGRKSEPAKEPGLYARLSALYASMESAYNACAREAGLRCDGCENNCCTGFFHHHTYVEWNYLWRGLRGLDEKQRRTFVERAEAYVHEARQSLMRDLPPSAMCPLNENGLCALYSHRLMICRLHGTRNIFTLPDGRQQVFPGCYRFAALPCALGGEAAPDACPSIDRTPFYKALAALEMEFQKKAARPLPRVNLTIAEMIVMGPPRLK